MNLKPIDYDVLKNMYLIEKIPIYKIASILNLSVGKIFNSLKKYNIETRSHSIATKGRRRTKEAIEKTRQRNTGLKRTKECRERQSAARKIHTMGHKKIRGDGYISLYFPDHLDSNADGYIMEHRYIMEQSIGQRISKSDVVHHINGDRKDNRIENLKLMSFTEHAKYHMIKRYEIKRGIN